MNRINYRTKILFWIAVILSALLIALCIRSSYTTYLFPIYPDEIAERILLSRFWYDFPIKFNLMPMCDTISPFYPKLWYFPGWVDWMIHGHVFNLKTFRIIGIITSWSIFVLFTIQICHKNLKLFKSSFAKLSFCVIVLGGVLSLFNVGVIPFVLVVNRPESIILLLLIALICIFQTPVKTEIKNLSLTFAFFMITSILFYSHPKTLILTPFLAIIACRLFFNFKNRYVSYGLLALFFITVLSNYHAWTSTFTVCKNSASVNNIFSNFNVDLTNLLKDPRQFFSAVWGNLSNYETNIHRIGFQENTEINYLPNIKINSFLKFFNTLIYINYIGLFFFLVISNSVSYFRDIVKHHFVTTNLLTLCLIVCAVINLLINNCKHWYDAGYIWGLLAVAALVCFSEHMPHLLKRKNTYLLIIYWLFFTIVSLLVLIRTYEPIFRGGFSGPGISLINYNHKKITTQLNNLARTCHIEPNHSKNLILEDFTYHFFQKSKYPLAYTYLFYGLDQNFLHQFTTKFQIDGLIIRAVYLPESLRTKYATQLGDFICVPKENIQPLFKEMLG